MPNGPWDDLRDSASLLARQGIAHNFAFHPGASGGPPLMVLDKLRPFTQTRASETLTQLRDATLDPSQKGKPQPGLSGFIWGRATLVQVDTKWVLRFMPERKPMPALVTTFVRRLKALNKEIDGAMPMEAVNAAELVFSEPSPIQNVDLSALIKRFEALEKQVTTAVERQERSADDADTLNALVGELELLLNRFPDDQPVPDPLLDGVVELTEGGKGVPSLPGRVGRLLDAALKLDDQLDEIGTTLRGAQPSEAARVRDTVGQALTAVEEGLQAFDEQLGNVVERIRGHRTTYNRVRQGLLDALQQGGGSTGTTDEVPLPANWTQLREEWDDANNKLARQLDTLRTKLKKSSDSELVAIADYGLAGITEGRRTPFVAALLEVEKASPKERGAALKKLARAAAAFSDQLETDPRVDAIEGNPFDVEVEILSTVCVSLRHFEAIAP